ncbi:MAG: hypothetical protein DI547_07520 [Sphingobium sp.]|nr:MAG: hypothetical protein DI547_07520 [Sphingobium sp.]
MRGDQRGNGKRTAWPTVIAILAIITVTAAILIAMGRPPICTCGRITLWEGAADSAETSQQLSDWYSFSHVIHGFLFYAAGYRLLRRRSLGLRLTIAVAVEAGWELLENSPVIIDRYRTATIALGYTGDSVLNSMSDIAMMTAGFLFAARMRWQLTLAVALAFELLMLAVIRDNLTLNVLMLVWPVAAIKAWQSGIGA